MNQGNNFPQLLKQWATEASIYDWVLGTVYKTEGPSYRKVGATMLFNSLGQQFGLLSGGCLESDLQRHAKLVMSTGQPTTLCYDGSDEDDVAFQLGIGCGGTIYIMLQPVVAENDFLGLSALADHLAENKSALYLQAIPLSGEKVSIEARVLTADDRHFEYYLAQLGQQKSCLVPLSNDSDGPELLITLVEPPVNLLVIGGGVDARPLVSMAAKLGWQVTLWDSRPANGRREHFLDAARLLSCPIEQLADHSLFKHFKAAVVMSHNLSMDADALNLLQSAALEYLALLGPESRKQAVLKLAGLSNSALSAPLHGPAGLALGGELPESLALSILAQCHAVLHHADGHCLSEPQSGPLP